MIVFPATVEPSTRGLAVMMPVTAPIESVLFLMVRDCGVDETARPCERKNADGRTVAGRIYRCSISNG
jgi:hypothetical protein